MNYRFFVASDDIPAHIKQQYPEGIRAKQIYSSRMALYHCIKDEQLTKEKFNLDKLNIRNHYDLESFPNYVCSISHTKHFGAATISSKEQIKSIGIDIELASRVPRLGSEKYFANAKDEVNLSPLELWVTKEACFKALSPIVKTERRLTLTQIWLTKNQFGFQEEIYGTWETSKALHNEMKFIVSIGKIAYSN